MMMMKTRFKKKKKKNVQGALISRMNNLGLFLYSFLNFDPHFTPVKIICTLDGTELIHCA